MEVGDDAVVLVVRDGDPIPPVEDVVLKGVVAGELFDNGVNRTPGRIGVCSGLS
ncbi:hypothetical protein ACIQMJ_26415 [Actinosynnema sp. NPDC091369]